MGAAISIKMQNQSLIPYQIVNTDAVQPENLLSCGDLPKKNKAGQLPPNEPASDMKTARSGSGVLLIPGH